MSFINDTASGEILPATNNSVPMSAKEFRLLSRLVESSCGIKMPDSKRSMLESRLQKRLRSLELRSFKAYFDLLASPEGRRHELTRMIDAVTTNKTDFFREPAHFRYLAGQVLPEMIGKGACGTLRVWSAGCSSGEEPYTLAMVLSEYASNHGRFPFSILATDICTTVLEKASRGIYEEEKIAPVSHELREKYLLRSRDRSRGVVRIAPELRSLVKFRRLNFMNDTFSLCEPMHIIFCRNVLIYFDRPTQEALLNKFCRHLVPGGYLFLGHSETINGMQVPVVQVDSTIYRKPE
ncbi:MAG TPA: protein-glutamate O-methyltransferase [Geobacteraceae bacterium]|nr:protein-glutamate O-methyltransferase [Geobacteraceae bacterium]